MKRSDYKNAESFMLCHMPTTLQDPVHDAQHVYRVVYAAVQIAKTQPAANPDVVVLAALLHDIGRKTAATPGESHAQLGAKMAYTFLRAQKWGRKTAAHVRDCIETHSYAGGNAPATTEAKILYDADKLDLAGALGVRRASLYGAGVGEPLYRLNAAGLPTRGGPKEGHSLFEEYHTKLNHMPRLFFTAEGKRLAKQRQKTMDVYFKALAKEVAALYKTGKKELHEEFLAD